jgi:hypothetical protein
MSVGSICLKVEYVSGLGISEGLSMSKGLVYL